jgi:hypothetical protein
MTRSQIWRITLCECKLQVLESRSLTIQIMKMDVHTRY